MRYYCKELVEFLKRESEEFSVVVMPDFFLDRLVSIDWNADTFGRNLRRVVRKKGGSIDGIAQMDLRGGNAVNTASALIALGVKVTPIVCTNALGLQLIRFHLSFGKVNFSHVKILGQASITTAMEMKGKDGKVNVMLRDVGALADFGPQHLNKDDFEEIQNSDYVCVFNWAGTRHYGTDLANTVFSSVKAKGKGKTYFDSADPTPNRQKIPGLTKDVLKSGNLDVLSVNENEAICYAAVFDKDICVLERELSFEEAAKEAARILASRLSTRVDLHTTSFSGTFRKKGETVIPAFRVQALRATGAGDAWNAGNIIGDANNLSDDCRLALANALAAYYISSRKGVHPTRKQLSEFCKKLMRKGES